ncbi:hypothetical protein [Mesomycoplasma dispar]|uniref:Uncharacterized protein n=1 Tax=Mesomycoplasma dispar TaxID=86660 RepID=A0ABN5DVA1_9BACT|nr:hypothetical protein [Mesomycoplasma dispar]ATP59602.1 hypothetical protein CSW10_01425 [Mesomycoplasma dispar]
MQSNQRIAKINEFEEKLHSLSVSLWSRYNVIEEVEWVVINKTPQTDYYYYYYSGTGGKNLVFKNLKTNETKTIEQMLEIDPLRLRKWGVIKVFNDEGKVVNILSNSSFYKVSKLSEGLGE